MATVGTLSALLRQVAFILVPLKVHFFFLPTQKPWKVPWEKPIFSQCGREVGLIFRPLLAAKGGNGDGVRDQDGLRASLVVPHPTIQFLGL